jgi:hypothetical protein
VYSWRITKYDPVKRDDEGSYHDHEEWTCFSEVGTKVSIDGYVKTEQKYLDAISSFMDEIGLNMANVKALEQWSDEDENPNPFLSEIQIGKVLNVQEIHELARLTVRNEVWCKLAYEDQFFVHFGYDYYMYIGAYKNCTKVIGSVTNSGLFVEEFDSPY